MAAQERYSQQPLGESEVFLDFQAKLSRVAAINRPVLLVGERGSGKEIAARRLHYLSPRWDKNLVTVNCAALPPSLIETELFGYEQGAFTGAQKTRKGRFEEAEGGTLFLDEIGLIPLEVQEKILRVVEYGTYERVGSSVTHEVNVRIIGATNADLPALCEEGKFKQDLLDRLSFEVLFLPPLRERGEDILTLAYFFASKMAQECDREGMVTFTDEVIDKLMAYRWRKRPGTEERDRAGGLPQRGQRHHRASVRSLRQPLRGKTGQSKEAELVLGTLKRIGSSSRSATLPKRSSRGRESEGSGEAPWAHLRSVSGTVSKVSGSPIERETGIA